MISHVHQALEQVRTIHHHILEKQRFKGYSGRARAASGCLALAAGFWLSRHKDPGRVAVPVWMTVALVGVAVNYGAVVIWFLGEPAGSRQAARLKPAIEVLPALFAGAVLTFGLWQAGAADLLPPTWMLLFGVANVASRHVLPRGIGWVGAYYLLAGTLLMLGAPRLGLANPWPMAIVFLVGEWLGGLILHQDGTGRRHWISFWGLPQGEEKP